MTGTELFILLIVIFTTILFYVIFYSLYYELKYIRTILEQWFKDKRGE